MRIKSLSYRNFARYGSDEQTINFESDDNLFLLSASNGSGKSTIAQVLSYALYGKVKDVKLGDLVNRINKQDLYTKIDLVTYQGKSITIERGIKPNIFVIHIDGEEYDQAGKSNTQEYLEELYGIPYHVFINIVVLSIDDFKSFVKMKRKDKEQIIDRIFGFTIINDMYKQIKDLHRHRTHSLNIKDVELNRVQKSINDVKNNISALQQKLQHKHSNQLQKLNESLDKLTDKYNEYKSNLSGLLDSKSEVKLRVDHLKDILTEKVNEYKSMSSGLKLYENETCPTCKSSLISNEHTKIKDQLENSLSEVKIEISSMKDEYTVKKSLYDKIKEKEDVLKGNVYSINAKIESINVQLKTLNEDKSSDSLDSLNSIRDNFLAETEMINNERIDIMDKLDEYDLLLDVLGESGVKKTLIQNVIPSLNASMSELSAAIHLPFSIKFNNSFDCIITQLGEEISPSTLSTGEYKKVDFVIIVSILKALKIRYPSLNVLFLDEIFSSIDPDGRHCILEILRGIAKESNLNTFVINHSQLPHELFDYVVTIDINDGFSHLNVEQIA